MKIFNCDACRALVFFENVMCLSCGHALGFLPDIMDMAALVPEGQGAWRSLASPTPRTGSPTPRTALSTPMTALSTPRTASSTPETAFWTSNMACAAESRAVFEGLERGTVLPGWFFEVPRHFAAPAGADHWGGW